MRFVPKQAGHLSIPPTMDVRAHRRNARREAAAPNLQAATQRLQPKPATWFPIHRGLVTAWYPNRLRVPGLWEAAEEEQVRQVR